MKFDVVIGNPPYNSPRGNTRSTKIRQIYPDFCRLAVKIAKRTLFVIPTRWMTLPTAKKIRLQFQNLKLTTVKVVDTTQRFFQEAVIEGGICIVDFHPEEYKNQTTFYSKDFSVIKSDLKDPIFLKKGQDIFQSILAKIQKKNLPYINSIWFQNQEFKSNDARIVPLSPSLPKIRTSKGVQSIEADTAIPCLNYNRYKTIISYTTSGYKTGYGKMDIGYPGEFVNMSYAYFAFDSLIEAQNCMKYLKSTFVMGIKNTTQENLNFTSLVFKNIPLLDYTKEWMEEDIYNFFELTPEEIAYLETQARNESI